MSQGAALAFQDFFDSTAALDRRPNRLPPQPPAPKLLAYLTPYSDPAGTAKHDTTWLAAAVRSGRVSGICDWRWAPRCPPDPRRLPAYVFEVSVVREARDTLVLAVSQVLPPQGTQLIAVYFREYTLVRGLGDWRIADRGTPRHDN